MSHLSRTKAVAFVAGAMITAAGFWVEDMIQDSRDPDSRPTRRVEFRS